MSEFTEYNAAMHESMPDEPSIDAMRAVFMLGGIIAADTIHIEVDAASAALEAAVENKATEERISQLKKNLSYWKQVEIGYRGTHAAMFEEK